MANQIASYKNKSKIILLLSIAVFIFWIFGKMTNVYHFPFVGAIFETLWLPIMILTFVLPVMSLVFWYKEKFDFRSASFYSIATLIMTILLLVFYK